MRVKNIFGFHLIALLVKVKNSHEAECDIHSIYIWQNTGWMSSGKIFHHLLSKLDIT